ncbi:hypothetical protein [Halomonas sp.]|uniref:hypothetical protein n=1 Tax=Halomonas sp. TaxID=1486246 RepID=UPI003D133593
MATLKLYRETALPGTLEANSMYFVAPAGSPDYVELYVTGNTAGAVRRIIKEDDVQALIDASLAGFGEIEVVADIAARDALTLTSNAQVLVLDASADTTVDSGAATYVYRSSDSSWTKISEAESLDLALTWAALDGKPSSAVADIDDAVTKRHTHANKTELDKIGEDGSGNLTYNGSLPATGWESANW